MMSEWDNDEELQSGKSSKKAQQSRNTGGLNVGMTVACFLAVTAVSFLTAWLLKDTVRNFLLMGVTFAAPFAALMCSAMAVEKATARMTPITSRNAQMICILVTVVAAFVIGCLAELLHQPVVIEHVEPEYDYLIVLDKSGSMVFQELEEPGKKALHELVSQMEDGNNLGIVAFGSNVVGEQAIRPLDSEQRQLIDAVIDTPNIITTQYDPETHTTYSEGDGTQFTNAMSAAKRLIEAMPEWTRTVRIILVTDGDSDSRGNFDAFNTWAERLNSQTPGEKRVELCAIQLGSTPMLDMVKDAVNKTGGTIYDNVKVEELAKQLQSLKNTLIIPEPVDTLKATYAGQTADGKPNTPYMILTCVLMILQGFLCGFALKIMFSYQGQFRFQTILSPLMGLCAFLLLNFGRYLGIAPAWICEAVAFSAFGLVFMRENLTTGHPAPRQPAPSGKQKKAPVQESTEAFDEDF